MNCRHCATPLTHTFLDLGHAPPSNAYLTSDDLSRAEVTLPLRLLVCDRCWLVQTEDFAAPEELFRGDYAYFSSMSAGWVAHAARFASTAVERLHLTHESQVLEIASNDGYLLRHFDERGIPCLGIEPTAGTAAAAEALGIPVVREFFDDALGARLAAEGRQADLIVGNNVYAHVPDLNGFTRGMKRALKPGGTISLEWPHLMRLIEHAQFDTAYHEHYSYFSLGTASRVLEGAALRVFDVEELPTHGGSLRVWACHAEDERAPTAAVDAILNEERRCGLASLDGYRDFQSRAERVKDSLLTFLLERKRAGQTVAAYGAAAKGNTILNFAGVKPDLLPFVCDAAPSKQHRYLPGSHIPILPPSMLRERRPDYVLILPWNIAGEIRAQCQDLEGQGTRFVTAVPELVVS